MQAHGMLSSIDLRLPTASSSADALSHQGPTSATMTPHYSMSLSLSLQSLSISRVPHSGHRGSRHCSTEAKSMISMQPWHCVDESQSIVCARMPAPSALQDLEDVLEEPWLEGSLAGIWRAAAPSALHDLVGSWRAFTSHGGLNCPGCKRALSFRSFSLASRALRRFILAEVFTIST